MKLMIIKTGGGEVSENEIDGILHHALKVYKLAFESGNYRETPRFLRLIEYMQEHQYEVDERSMKWYEHLKSMHTKYPRI